MKIKQSDQRNQVKIKLLSYSRLLAETKFTAVKERLRCEKAKFMPQVYSSEDTLHRSEESID